MKIKVSIRSQFISADSVKEGGGTGVDIGGVSIAMSWLPTPQLPLTPLPLSDPETPFYIRPRFRYPQSASELKQ